MLSKSRLRKIKHGVKVGAGGTRLAEYVVHLYVIGIIIMCTSSSRLIFISGLNCIRFCWNSKKGLITMDGCWERIAFYSHFKKL